MSGTVYLVGAGPGAPDLLTLRAARLLGEADIVFHDALVHPGTLALAARAEKVAVGKRCGRHSTVQQFINKRLIDAARRHKVVVRLKGGDPMLFGRAQEELDALSAAGIRCEVVPGVTAALAAETVALYMGAGEAGAIAAALIAAGKPAATPVAIAESVSLDDSMVAAGELKDLAALAERRGNGPALLLIGEVWARLAAQVARRARKASQSA